MSDSDSACLPFHTLLTFCTGWRRPIGCLKMQVIFRKRATNYRALLRKMTYKDKASYESSPPFIQHHDCPESSKHTYLICNLQSAMICNLTNSSHYRLITCIVSITLEVLPALSFLHSCHDYFESRVVIANSWSVSQGCDCYYTLAHPDPENHLRRGYRDSARLLGES